MGSRNALLAAFATCIAGCAATPLQSPEAASIMVTRNPPGKECQFLGEVSGSQGNFVTANLTRDQNLVAGARNQMRDAAYELGANYVQIEFENPSDNTSDDSLGGVYSSTVIGNAYYCPDIRSAKAGQ